MVGRGLRSWRACSRCCGYRLDQEGGLEDCGLKVSLSWMMVVGRDDSLLPLVNVFARVRGLPRSVDFPSNHHLSCLHSNLYYGPPSASCLSPSPIVPFLSSSPDHRPSPSPPLHESRSSTPQLSGAPAPSWPARASSVELLAPTDLRSMCPLSHRSSSSRGRPRRRTRSSTASPFWESPFTRGSEGPNGRDPSLLAASCSSRDPSGGLSLIGRSGCIFLVETAGTSRGRVRAESRRAAFGLSRLSHADPC